MRKLLPIIVIAAALAGGAYVGLLLNSKRAPRHVGPVLVASFLNAELGNAIVFQTPENRFIVVDPGSEDTAGNLIDYLHAAGVKSLDVIATDDVEEHAGALGALVDEFNIKRIVHGGSPWPEAPKGPNGPIMEVVLAAGDTIRLSPKVKLEVLSPAKAPVDSRVGPLVTRVSFGRTRFLLTHNARMEDEACLIRSGTDLTSTVLVTPVHGRKGGTSVELLSLVRPAYCVVLAGTGADRPSKAVLDRIKTENSGAEVHRTDKEDVIDMISDGRSIQVETGVSEP